MPRTITRRSTLVEILTSIIFVCGPGHSAINFSQYEYMSFVPNMPLSIYKDVQLLADQKEPITDQQLMEVRLYQHLAFAPSELSSTFSSST